MATKTKTQVPVTPTPAVPAKNALPTPKPFTEHIPLLETDTESATVQMTAMSEPPPNEQGKSPVLNYQGTGDRPTLSPLGYQFSQIDVAPRKINPALLQSQTEDEDRHKLRQDGTFETSQTVEKRIQAKRGKGQPLPNGTRSFMEDRFGNDFGQVRIHTDSTAVQLSQDLQAKAFTHGHDIYFNSGQYNPGSTSGKRLLAHELTHTIQQKGAKLKPKKVDQKTTKSNKISSETAQSTTEKPIKRKPLAQKIQRKQTAKGIEVNLKPLEGQIQRKTSMSGIDVNLKPLGSNVQPKQEYSGIDVNLKPLPKQIQQKPESEGNGIDVNLKPLTPKVQPKEEYSGIDVNLKPLAARIQRTPGKSIKIQPELIVGAPGDRYEQEADLMADRVMKASTPVQRDEEPEQQPDNTTLQSSPETLQRINGRPNRRRTKAIPYAAILGNQEESEDEQNVNITLKREEEAEESPAPPPEPQFPQVNTDEQNVNITLKPEPNPAIESPVEINDSPATVQADSDGSFQASSGIESKIKSKEGGGSSLPTETKGFMESRFNNDFSGVRVHTDSDAVQMNKDLGAKAFTHKKDIYFNSGQYNPGSTSGKHLLAHELTHTIQQTGPSVKTQPDVQKADDQDTEDETENKDTSTTPVEQKTEITEEDMDENEREKLAKRAEKTEKDVEKGKKDEQGKEEGDKEGKDKENQQEDVTPKDESELTTPDIKDELEQGLQPPVQGPPMPIMVPQVSSDQGDFSDPMQNPAFNAVKQQIEQQGDQFSSHDDPQKEVVETQESVVDPNKQDRDAKGKKTDTSSSLDPETFDREAFVQQLLAALGIEEPKNMKDVEGGGGVGSEVEGTVKDEVGGATTKAGGGMPESTQVPPDPTVETPKIVKEMPPVEDKIAVDEPPVNPELAVPPKTSNKDVEEPLKEQTENLEDTFGPIQPKLRVGGPQDKYEKEADSMADRVMQMGDRQSDPQPKVQPEVEPKRNKLKQAKLERTVDPHVMRAKSLAEMIQRSPQWIIQRKNSVEPQTIEQPNREITLTTENMETFGDMGGDKAIDSLKESKDFSEKGPEKFREEEQGTLTQTKTKNKEKAQQTKEQQKGVRTQTMVDMTTKKQETKGANEAARLKITAKLNKIYEESQAKVNGILAEMDAGVQARMKSGLKLARRAFERVQKAAFKKWQKNYYYHRHGIKIKILWKKFKIFNIFLWAKEKLFTGLPDEVNEIYSDAREVYVGFLRQSIGGTGDFNPTIKTKEVKSVLKITKGLYDQLDPIAPFVEKKMIEAKTAIDEGKTNFQAAVDELGPEEKQLAEGAIANIKGQFDGLENNVKAYQDNLINDITENYKQGLQEIDDRIEALKAANEGLVKKALAFIGDLMIAIIKALLAPIKWILSKFGIDTSILDAIIEDPGGFMKNLFTGLKDGFLNFAKNFPKHFLNGMVEWLFGNLGPITLPKKFDIQGFFQIFMQIMGLTVDSIFDVASGVFGSDLIGAIRSAIEGADIEGIIAGLDEKVGMVVQLFYTLVKDGIGKAWSFLIDIFNEMKMEFIKELTIMASIEVIKAATTWLIGILNPAAGIVKIIKAIVDVIIWFAQNYEQVVELIKTIFAGMTAIANGDTATFSLSVEMALARIIPIALGFMASLIGLGGIVNKIRGILEKITGFFRRKLEKLFQTVVAPIKKKIDELKAKAKEKYEAAKAKVKEKYESVKAKVKEKYESTKERVKSAFKSDKEETEEDRERKRQEAEYKRKLEQQKDEVKDMVSEGETSGERLIKTERNPKEVKQGLGGLEQSIEQGKEFATVGSLKVKQGFFDWNEYKLVGTIKKEKISKTSTSSGTVQRKTDKWKDKKNKLIVEDDSVSNEFVLKAKLMDESDVLPNLGRDLEKRARKDKDPDKIRPVLPKLKQQYDLTSIELNNKTGIFDRLAREVEYEIVAQVPKEETEASRKAAPGKLLNAPIQGNLEQAIQRSQGRGEPLSEPVRQPMEHAFGVDFSGVRIHRNSEGDRLSRSLNAQAFTTGKDIYFRKNTYRPDTPSGGHLLAHELTHVVQQSGDKPQVQRTPFFPDRLVQRQGDGPPPKPLASHGNNFTLIQRKKDDSDESEEGSSDFQRTATAVGVVAVGTAIKLHEARSRTKTDVDVYKDIDKKKGRLEVFVRVKRTTIKAKKQKMQAVAAGEEPGIPEFTRTLIAKHIETIVRQDPSPEVVQKKLAEVTLKFDLDLVKVVGFAAVGQSFEYKVLAQGNPRAVAQKKIEDMLKKMAKMSGPKQQQETVTEQDTPTEIPTETPAPDPTPDKTKTKKKSSQETQEGPSGTTSERPPTTTAPVKSQKAKTTKMKGSGQETDEGGPQQTLSAKTQIKPGGDPKTLFVTVRVDPEDKK
ncbi:DUF4157 domain-containing protein [Roseofilum reptotaenium CS-1145]|uniref:eCIS core domain-containing protein n=1 Tax=Roseofilum reptotaenium AO1-A TaxID=1925591 RepID=A0A1L9QTY8_9CYAN|nr:DUF4157 domain-containing protein [Roseofilum reptotaenium]MDB9518352.1 DUF4157 domain-containing protein [Roseofilum reptotaenium CS-1145]OJJ26150.1 hypothetical protein BI308_08190 [Roseofilum reptotaenium AO1-A]